MSDQWSDWNNDDFDSEPDTDSFHKEPDTPQLETSRNDAIYHQVVKSFLDNNHEIKQKVEDLETRVKKVEELSSEKRKFLEKVNKLLTIVKCTFIALPIISFLGLAISQYVFYDDNTLLNFITAVIGVLNVAVCIFIPLSWRRIEDKVDELEDKFHKLDN